MNNFLHFPYSSLAEIEKLYHIALNGSEEEKSAAANILCGASVSRGWNIQVASLVILDIGILKSSSIFVSPRGALCLYN